MRNLSAAGKDNFIRGDIRPLASSPRVMRADYSSPCDLGNESKARLAVESQFDMAGVQARNYGRERQNSRAAFFFGVGSIGLCKRMGREACTLEGAAKHNFREVADERGGYMFSYAVDPAQLAAHLAQFGGQS